MSEVALPAGTAPEAGLVSTIIPVHNRAEMLSAAVQSVLDQTWGSTEIIISDDGSTDETTELGRSLADRYPGRIVYLWSPNRGAGVARESGRRLARGEFIQYLDSDDTLCPRKFEVQIDALRRRPSAGAAYGWIRLCPENGPPAERPHKWSGRELRFLFPHLLVDRWWNTNAPLWRRTVCDRIGPWSSLRYSQDWEYDARAGALGTELVYCAEFVTHQRHHASDRQTGHGRWLAPPDRVRFFSTLHRCAVEAGVQRASPEMRHFARWVFRQAREVALMDDVRSASELIQLSLDANPGALDVQAFGWASNLVGARRLAAWSERVRRIVGKQPGRATRKQSWMAQ